MNTPIPSLFRYYMTMSLARQQFKKFLPEANVDMNTTDAAQAGMEFMFTKAGLMMQLWYGMLFVVVEGWEQSGLSDPEIETLLQQKDFVDKLRNFRNAVFHYQKQFLPVKQEGLFSEPTMVKWITELSDAFTRKLLEAMRAESAPKP